MEPKFMLINSLNGVDLTHPSVLPSLNGFYSGWLTAPNDVPPSPYPGLYDWATHVLHLEGRKWGEFSQWELSLLQTGWGTQGVTRPWTLVEPQLDLYYERAGRYVSFPPIPWQVSRIVSGMTAMTEREVFETYKGDHKSNSGMYGWTDRRSPGLAAQAFATAMESPYTFAPAILGQKFEFGKLRTIFMDDFANYFREAPAWAPLAARFRNSGVCPEVSQDALDQMVAEWFAAHPTGYTAYEFDADSMDTWVDTFKLSHIERHLDEHGASDAYLADFSRQFGLWEMPVLTPVGLRTGYHSLFSGLFPTHTVENHWTSSASFDFVNRKIKWRRRPQLGRDYLLFVCGDDVALIVDNTTVLYHPSMEEMASHWEEWGMRAKPEKQRRASNAGFFYCKRFYHHANTHSVYPLARAIISFCHPKSGDDMRPNGYNVVRFCALMDNSQHHPKYIEALVKMVETFPWLTKYSPAQSDVDAYNAKVDNWRIKCLGQTFNLSNSTTFQLLNRLVQVKA